MALKDDAREWTVREQIVEDLATGLTLQFEVVPDSAARYRLRISGDLQFGNRVILFDAEGTEAGSGSTLTAPL